MLVVIFDFEVLDCIIMIFFCILFFEYEIGFVLLLRLFGFGIEYFK